MTDKSIIKILDCTLRDGGYINDWNFGIDNSKKIIYLLKKANIDYIETGFLSLEEKNINQTLYGSFEKIKKFLPDNINKDRLLAMISFGKFPIELVPEVKDSPVCGLRICFKKTQKNEALKFCQQIKDKGYKLFINIAFTDQYSDEELSEVLKSIKKINPYAVSIVDSMGVMEESDIIRLFRIINSNLSQKTTICFHSHNNLQLSFSNAISLINLCKKRELIIDSTIFGMGRGAGNLCTELITQYLNQNYNSEYDINFILQASDEFINNIYKKTPWGYSIPYYLSAKNHCHPNYAKYLVEKKVSNENIDKILKQIPKEEKSTYNIDVIEKVFRLNYNFL